MVTYDRFQQVLQRGLGIVEWDYPFHMHLHLGKRIQAADFGIMDRRMVVVPFVEPGQVQ